jgi:hypothetical protein
LGAGDDRIVRPVRVFFRPLPATTAQAKIAAAALISLIGGTSIIGRLVLGPIGDQVGFCGFSR